MTGLDWEKARRQDLIRKARPRPPKLKIKGSTQKKPKKLPSLLVTAKVLRAAQSRGLVFGDCRSCGQGIQAGQVILLRGPGRYVHRTCNSPGGGRS